MQADVSPVAEASVSETDSLNATIDSMKQELDTSSSIESQSDSLLLLDQDAPVEELISDTFKDEKIEFIAPSNLELLSDDFSLNPLNETTEQVIDEVMSTGELKMELGNDIIIE